LSYSHHDVVTAFQLPRVRYERTRFGFNPVTPFPKKFVLHYAELDEAYLIFGAPECKSNCTEVTKSIAKMRIFVKKGKGGRPCKR